MSSSSFEQGDIIVALIPFSNLVQAKIRPALVISGKRFNSTSEDLIVLKITSKEKNYPFDVSLNPNDLDFGKLTQESAIMADFPIMIEKQNAKQTIGKISWKKLSEVKEKMKELYEL
jgi:mRNA-degrading endonuclease toxin of MazEF toxin-antitoxin module